MDTGKPGRDKRIRPEAGMLIYLSVNFICQTFCLTRGGRSDHGNPRR